MIYRDTKGFPLTAAEVDANFREVATATGVGIYVTPEMFGGSLQSALDYGNDTPVTVYLKPGTVYDGTGVEITKKYVTVTGGGTITNGITVNGYVSDVLPGIKLYTVFDGITFKYGTAEPVDDVATGTTIAAGNHGITLHDCANIDVANCKFFYCDAAVYIPHKTTQQHVNRVKIHGNSIQTCNYVLLSLRTDLATNSPMYNFGDIHVVNNQSYNTQISHIHAEGADGLVCSDNSFFFGPVNTTKMYNIYVNFGNWVHIHNNNLFESGRDSIWLNEIQNPNVSGNNIAWPGQWVNSHGIRLTGGGPAGTATNAYTLGTIANNNIMYPSYCGISIEDKCGFISITGNQIRSAGDISTGHWLGTDNTGLSHYYIQTEASTTYITHSGNMGSGGPATGNNFLGTGIYQPEEVNVDYHIKTVTTASATMSVEDIHEIRLNDSSTGTITNLTGGISGQEITIISYQTDKTTITNSSPATDKIRLRNNASRLMGLYESVRLRFMAGTWFEVGGDSASMVTLYAAQTLTNKTLTSPAITGGTVNNATIGATTATTGKFTTVEATKSFITAEGGIAVKLVAGEDLAQGEIVYIKTTSGADGKVWKAPTSNDMPIGAVYAAASANADVWVVVSGIALVKPAAAVTATRGYVIFVSATTAGAADQSATGGATAEHWRECGHWLDTGSGAAALTRAVLHFN